MVRNQTENGHPPGDEQFVKDQLIKAITTDDVSAVRAVLQDANARGWLDEAMFPYGRTALLEARSAEMVDVLVDAGADVVRASEVASQGFLLEVVPDDVAVRLLAKGFVPTIHAASALGLVDLVQEMLDANPSLLEAKGGDSGTPLHFARTVEVAQLLVKRGANVDARDDDHRSTPAQWRIKASPKVAQYLLNSGAAPDVFLAAALGDLDLTHAAIEANPACVNYRIGYNSGPFPGIGFEGTGGTILQWTLGFNQSPHEIASKRGYETVFDLLLARSPPKARLLAVAMLGNRELAQSVLAEHPDLVETFDDEDRMLLAKACWETNNDTEGIRVMLECGFPVGVREHNHGAFPLHNAAWAGNSAVVRLLLEYGHPIDLIDPAFDATAAGYAIHSATVARKYRGEGIDYAGVIDALIEAGLDSCLSSYPTGHDEIDAVMARHLNER
jgi:ankyrin repeat protein